MNSEHCLLLRPGNIIYYVNELKSGVLAGEEGKEPGRTPCLAPNATFYKNMDLHLG